MAFNMQTSIKALGLSTRTTNALTKNGIKTVQDLFVLFDVLSENELHSIKGIGKTCFDEIQRLMDYIRTQKADENNIDTTQTLFENNYPDNSEKIIRQPCSLGEYWKNIQKSGRNFSVLVEYYNDSKTLQELGQKHKVSRERIRQIILKGTERLHNAFINGMIDGRTITAIEDYAEKRTEIHMIKIPDNVFTGAGIVHLVSSFEPAIYKTYKNVNLNGEWLIKAEDKVGKVLDVLLDELKHRSSPLTIAEIEQLYSINDNMLMSIKGIVEKDGHVTHRNNKIATGIDKNRIITRYLESINRPASITEITNNTTLDKNQVRSALTNRSAYVNVGRSVYDLIDRNYDNSSIIDLAINILIAENRALKEDVISKYIRKYKTINKMNITIALSNTKELYRHGNYLLIKDWDLNKIESNNKNNYYVSLKDAILEIINASDELFDSEKVMNELEKYNGAVSTNMNSIKATLIQLADKKLITRVGGARTGRYIRNQNNITTSNQTSKNIKSKTTLGSFIDANIGKNIEIRYKTQRKNSDKRWRIISIRGQDSRYIYTNDLNVYGYRIKYLKERVVEYKNHIPQPASIVTESNPQIEQKDEETVKTIADESPNWYEDVYSYIKKLGKTFTIAQVYEFEKELSERHPNNKNVRAKIRQQIRIIKRNKKIDTILPGVYHKNENF